MPGRIARFGSAGQVGSSSGYNAGAGSPRKRRTSPPPSSSSAAARLANATGRTSTNAGDSAGSRGRVDAPRGLAPSRRHHARNVASRSPRASANATCVNPLRRHASTTSTHHARFAARPLAMLASRAVHPLSREGRGSWRRAVGRRWSNAYDSVEKRLTSRLVLAPVRASANQHRREVHYARAEAPRLREAPHWLADHTCSLRR
jgi:hypothetical protein